MIRKALQLATPSLRELARAVGVNYHTLRQYAKGQRTAPPNVVRKLAAALRAQVGRLVDVADELEATAKRTT